MAGFVLVAVGLAWFLESQATTTILFVRHAEKAVQPVSDPGLSPQGQARARLLARVLGEADVVAGVDFIYASQYRRTQETALPLARRLDLTPILYNASDVVGVLEKILREHKGRIILVVAHSDTIPQMVAELGGSKNVPPIAENEHDNLYVVTIPWFGKTKTLRFKYGEPPSQEDAALPGGR
ncbi:MAG: phosphoglycerate mutase family protein [Gammaproteobacteria bacterium]|jgi:2,3-bisphosphoglycerate-dependent phosphoglycerate mutase